MIPKADLKRECPYFYSNFFLKSFGQYKKSQQRDFQLYFQKVICPAKGIFLTKKNSEKAKHPQICQSLGGSIPEAQL